MQDSGPTTTATSEAEGRLKASVGGTCLHGKKGKCLKCLLSDRKKDGQGGPGVKFPLGLGGYGATKVQRTIIPKARNITVGKGKKIKGISIKPKKMTFGKALSKNSLKIKSLKSILKGKVFRGL